MAEGVVPVFLRLGWPKEAGEPETPEYEIGHVIFRVIGEPLIETPAPGEPGSLPTALYASEPRNAQFRSGLAGLLRKAADEIESNIPDAEVLHGVPPLSSGVTPCCGKTPFELDPGSRMTLRADLVTCKGAKP